MQQNLVIPSTVKPATPTEKKSHHLHHVSELDRVQMAYRTTTDYIQKQIWLFMQSASNCSLLGYSITIQHTYV